jgi:hypothetical protein
MSKPKVKMAESASSQRKIRFLDNGVSSESSVFKSKAISSGKKSTRPPAYGEALA